MIRLTCTNCRTVLDIDDGFAGGVCRCQHCGTIQTVPANLKGTGPSGPKTLYQNQSQAAATTGTGLDDLANVVASSGLTGSGSGLSNRLKKKTSALATTERPPSKRSVLLIAGIGVVVVAGAVGAWLATRGSNTHAPEQSTDGGTTSTPTHTGTGSTTSQPPPVVKGPSLLGLKLQGSQVIYLLDRSTVLQPVYDQIIGSVQKSLDTLSPSMKYQVIFWEVNGNVEQRPESPEQVSAASVTKTKESIEEVVCNGRGELLPALNKAIEKKPDQIVVVTGKELEAETVDAAIAATQGKSIHLDALFVGSGSGVEALKKLSEKTGGTFRTVSTEELNAYTR